MSDISKIKPNGAEGNEYDLKDAFAREEIQSTKSASGNPLTLTDAAPINAEKLEVVLEPKQDLHGQSYPYVGGAGKNLFGGVYYDLFPLHFNANTTITVSADTKGGSGNIQVYYYDENRQQIDYWGLSQSGDRDFKTFEYPSTAYFIAFRTTESTNYQVEVGSVMTPFAPYSNICPISGYDSVSVDDVGKNLFDANQIVIDSNHPTYCKIEDGYLKYLQGNSSTTGFVWDNLALQCPLRFSGKIKNFEASNSETTDIYIFYSDGTSASISLAGTLTAGQESAFDKVIGTSGKTVVKIQNSWSYTRALGFNLSFTQLEYGETATTYEPYQSTTTSVTFGQTVYGGKSDFVEGGTKVTKKYVDLGDLTWSRGGTNVSGKYRFYVALNPNGAQADTAHNTATCSQYKLLQAGGTYQANADGFTISSDNDLFVFVEAYCTYTADQFKTAMSGVQLVYELATPTTITTPIAPLKLLDGINNISTNGTTINLGYQQNNVVGELKGEIEQAFYNHAMIYNIQSESTALNMEYTDDYKAVVCEVPFVQEQHDYSTTPPTHWRIDLSACDIAVNGFACFYADSGGIFIENYKVMPTIESVRKDDGCFKVGIGFYNVKMASAADNIDNFIISMDITAFGKVLDSRTV